MQEALLGDSHTLRPDAGLSLFRARRAPKKSVKAEDSVFATTAAQPRFSATRQAIGELVALMNDAPGLDRADLRKRIEESLNGVSLAGCAANEEPLNSLIDVIHVARRFGIINHPQGWSEAILADFLTVLYMTDSPFLRTSGVELTHVPMVVQAALECVTLLAASEGRMATVRELTLAFLAANLHDAGKFDINIKTTKGFTIGADSKHNPYRVKVEVPAGKSAREVIIQMGLDPDKMKWIDYFMVSVFTHQDAQAVWRFLQDLTKRRTLTAKERDMVWSAIQDHGFASGYILFHSTRRPVSIRSRVFDLKAKREYRDYEVLALELAHRLKDGESLPEIRSQPDLGNKLTKLRDVQSGLGLLSHALNVADRVGQNDPAKYLDLLSNGDRAKGYSLYQIVFGCDLAGNKIENWQYDSFWGVLNNEECDLTLLEPLLARRAKGSFDVTRNWLLAAPDAPGLSRAILENDDLNRSYQSWQSGLTPGQDTSVLAWLDQVKVFDGDKKSAEFLLVKLVIKTALYRHYAPDHATDTPSRFSLLI